MFLKNWDENSANKSLYVIYLKPLVNYPTPYRLILSASGPWSISQTFYLFSIVGIAAEQYWLVRSYLSEESMTFKSASTLSLISFEITLLVNIYWVMLCLWLLVSLTPNISSLLNQSSTWALFSSDAVKDSKDLTRSWEVLSESMNLRDYKISIIILNISDFSCS